MQSKFNFGANVSNIVYVRAVAVADLPDELRAQIPNTDEIYAVHNAAGDRLALVPNKRLAFELAKENDLGRAQLIDATHSANFSAGVWYCKVLRGLSFN